MNISALEKLAKWRMVFTGWQLGTRQKGDPEGDAVRDLQEARLLLRAEVSALTHILLEKGICTQAELIEKIELEAMELDKMLEKKFPGFKSNENGMVLDQRAVETMSGWRP